MSTDTLAALGRIEHQAIISAPASGHGRFVVVLLSSVTGELERKQAPTRAKAFEIARDLAIEA